MTSGKLGVIGVGNMGSAIIRGLLSHGVYEARQVYVFDADPVKAEPFGKEGLHVADSVDEIGETSDTVIIAVKPATVGEVLAELGQAPVTTLMISVAAGITTKTIEAMLPEHPVVRVMPNTPCMVGAGASGVTRGTNARDEHVRRALDIMGALGYAVEVPESLMDAVTGLSASGPAYVAVMIDALMQGGVRMGIPRPVALHLAAQTVFGAAKMILDRNLEPSALRDMVTSPGGTTAEGLVALEASAFRYAVMDAVEAATLRSQELGE
jgi:pyrroline-5-carboxylate reductase